MPIPSACLTIQALLRVNAVLPAQSVARSLAHSAKARLRQRQPGLCFPHKYRGSALNIAGPAIPSPRPPAVLFSIKVASTWFDGAIVQHKYRTHWYGPCALLSTGLYVKRAGLPKQFKWVSRCPGAMVYVLKEGACQTREMKSSRTWHLC